MAELTAKVKRHLKVTWTSQETDAEVSDIMGRAEGMLDDLLGEALTYDDTALKGRDLDLYLNLCLYLYNGLTETEFMDAYAKPLTIARQFHVDPINTDTEEDEDEDEQNDPAIP